jgi:hypothetical protein
MFCPPLSDNAVRRRGNQPQSATTATATTLFDDAGVGRGRFDGDGDGDSNVAQRRANRLSLRKNRCPNVQFDRQSWEFMDC